jgi:CRP/FNR family transcriptional regulator, cyclic AMP receptor protein
MNVAERLEATKGTVGKYWYLRNFRPFKELTDEEVELLNLRSCMIRLNKGEFLYLPDEPLSSLYFLKKGLIRIGHYTEDGREAVLDILQPGEIFGELTKAEPGTFRGEFAQAYADETYICGMFTPDFENLLRVRPSLGITLLRSVGGRLQRMERKLESLAFKDAKVRVLELLMELAPNGESSVGEKVIALSLSHQDIADLTATSRQTVNKILTELKDRGIISYDRRKLVLHDIQALMV